jgi:hypothetical protein
MKALVYDGTISHELPLVETPEGYNTSTRAKKAGPRWF